MGEMVGTIEGDSVMTVGKGVGWPTKVGAPVVGLYVGELVVGLAE